jgi:hypothetical protein
VTYQVGVFERATWVFFDVVAEAVRIVIVQIGEDAQLWRNVDQWSGDIRWKNFAAFSITEELSILHRKHNK